MTIYFFITHLVGLQPYDIEYALEPTYLFRYTALCSKNATVKYYEKQPSNFLVTQFPLNVFYRYSSSLINK